MFIKWYYLSKWLRGKGAEGCEKLVDMFAHEPFFDACSTDEVRAAVWDKTPMTVKDGADL